MGQKINPNILRLGVTKHWKTEFSEKTFRELPRYTFKDLELKFFTERFLECNGMFLQDYRQSFNNSFLNLYVSYFITPHFVEKKKKKNITRILLVNSKKEKKLIVKVNNLEFNSSYIKKSQTTKNPFLFFKSKVEITKINRYLTVNQYIKLLSIYYNFNKKFKKVNKGIVPNFCKTLNLFTNNKFNIVLNFSCFNKELNVAMIDTKIKLLMFKLKRFKNMDFFKNGIELLLNSIVNENSAHLLAKFIAFQIKTNKRHKFFFSFLKKILLLLLKSNISVLKGVKIKIKGRLNGAPKAKQKIITIGDIPAQSIDTFLDYSHCATHNKNGTYGIKVWVSSK